MLGFLSSTGAKANMSLHFPLSPSSPQSPVEKRRLDAPRMCSLYYDKRILKEIQTINAEKKGWAPWDNGEFWKVRLIINSRISDAS